MLQDGMGAEVTVVAYLWNDGSREYLPEHVNILARQIRETISIPHQFVCITDEVGGFDEGVEVVPLPAEARYAASLKTPHGPRFPSSFRRLWTFSGAAAALGQRLFMIDIDCIVVDDLAPLVAHMDATGADFVGWRPPTTWGNVRRVAGGTWLLRAGAHREVWEAFSEAGLRRAQAAGQRGSDQCWISYCLAARCEIWPKGHGIYEAQWMRPNRFEHLPPGARIIHFNGKEKPWDMLHIPWIRERWH